MKKAGTFWLPDSDNYFYKFFESGEGFQLDRLHGALQYVTKRGVAIDGGAHVGSWTKVMATIFDTVVAFEPAADTFECLKLNTSTLGNVELHHEALGDKTIKVRSMDDETRQGNTGSRFVEVSDSGDVDMVTIDSLNLTKLDFLKLDLEGAEILALRGAERTLRSCRPVVYVEAKKGMAERFGEKTNVSLQYLRDMGAKQVAKFGSDYVFVFDKLGG